MNKADVYPIKNCTTEVCKFANVLKNNGLKREIESAYICLWFQNLQLLFWLVLRIGAIHSVVFAGFSAKALSDRINDATCNILITADGGFRGAKITPLKRHF